VWGNLLFVMIRSTVIALALADGVSGKKYARGFVRQQFNGIQEVVSVTEADIAATPSSIDWSTSGATSPVKDQGQCGSCWAYSTTEGIESAVYMAQGKMVELSPQQIISCDTTDGGCNGGDLPTAFKYVMDAGGIDSDADYPESSNGGGGGSGYYYGYYYGSEQKHLESQVKGDSGNCTWDGKKVASVTSWKYAVPPCNSGACDQQDETTLAAVIAKSGPVSICVNAQSWDSYSGGILKGDCSAAYNDMDHCVQLVGFDLDAKYWKVRNSWGSSWGENGFIRLPFGVNSCSVASEAVLPIATLDSATAVVV